MIVLLTTIPILYIVAVILLSGIWKRMPEIDLKDCDLQTRFSVVIPFRNEYLNIPRLITSLSELNYPSDMWEAVFVDDHSDDGGDELIREICDTNSRFRLVRLADRQGKKAAITAGIETARFNYILTTDADCRMPRDLLKFYNSVIQQDEPVFVSGPVRLETASGRLVEVFQTYEQAALTAVGGISIQLGWPTMCNGANMCFSKEVFESINGYEGNADIPTGDDQFLLMKVSSRYPGRVRFIRNAAAAVTTPARGDWQALFEQRTRWASKWKATGGWLAGAAVFTGLTYIALVLLFVLCLLRGQLEVFLLLIGIKTIADAWFVRITQYTRTTRFEWAWWPVIQVIYPFYVLMVIVRSGFGQYTWKGRRYSSAV